MVYFIVFYSAAAVLTFTKFTVKIFDRFGFKRKMFALCLILLILAFILPYIKIPEYKILLMLSFLSLLFCGIFFVFPCENFGLILIKIILISILSQALGFCFYQKFSTVYGEFWFGAIIAVLSWLLLNTDFQSIGIMILGQLFGIGCFFVLRGVDSLYAYDFIISTIFAVSLFLIIISRTRPKLEESKHDKIRMSDFIP